MSGERYGTVQRKGQYLCAWGGSQQKCIELFKKSPEFKSSPLVPSMFAQSRITFGKRGENSVWVFYKGVCPILNLETIIYI